MKRLHLVPGGADAGLLEALRRAGPADEVAALPDLLSWGPLHPDARAVWFSALFGAEVDGRRRAFWDHVATAEGPVVVWFGRAAASDLAFALALADRIGSRPCRLVDVTGRQFPILGREGAPSLSEPAQAVGMVPEDHLGALLDDARPAAADDLSQARAHWRRLISEDAPFRIVTPQGLASAPLTYFDEWILKLTTSAWKPVVTVIGETIGEHRLPYNQVNDLQLLTRIADLVQSGDILADGDPFSDFWDLRSRRIRLAV